MRVWFGLVIIFVSILLGIGWILNIIDFIGCDFEAPYKAEVIRGVGIFIPFIGGVTGWMDLGV